MLVDTCVLIEHFKGNVSVSEFLKSHMGKLSISSVTDMGMAQGVRDKKELRIYEQLLRSLSINIIEIDEGVSLKARLWVRTYGLSHNLCLADSLIAATAFSANLTVVTFNIKDFRFLDLELLSP
ncbi:MAG: type II toxin-antitoxin system VapC family toxin [Thiotrichaceae bacterium]